MFRDIQIVSLIKEKFGHKRVIARHNLLENLYIPDLDHRKSISPNNISMNSDVGELQVENSVHINPIKQDIIDASKNSK